MPRWRSSPQWFPAGRAPSHIVAPGVGLVKVHSRKGRKQPGQLLTIDLLLLPTSEVDGRVFAQGLAEPVFPAKQLVV